ncbi:acyl-CoA N-acyltransferase [Aspergillus karnatakaensis]|uniref:GNAT family N-acetyltransferase n=1 Tax=Aspergillus karnatakaensis TaxID=1810916 RepID=UPI003CCD1EFC
MERTTEDFSIISARTADHIATVRNLFTAYVKWLDMDLGYQDFQTELDSLPGKYAAPQGELLLAYSREGATLGCVALRSLSNQQQCEMKRLYVSPEARGMGLGKALVAAIVQRAKDLKYEEMRLDTMPFMGEAIQMYERFGFVQIQPYYDAPMETIFLALDLTG